MPDERGPQRLFTTIQWMILLVCTFSPVVGFALLSANEERLGAEFHIYGLPINQGIWFTLAAVMGMVAAVVLAGRMLLATRPALLVLVMVTVLLGLASGLLLQSSFTSQICTDLASAGTVVRSGFPYAWFERTRLHPAPDAKNPPERAVLIPETGVNSPHVETPAYQPCKSWQVILPGMAVDILFWFNLGVVLMVLVTLLMSRRKAPPEE